MRLTRAEREAKKAYKKELIEQGVDKDVAETMAQVFVEYGIVRPVVNTFE